MFFFAKLRNSSLPEVNGVKIATKLDYKLSKEEKEHYEKIGENIIKNNEYASLEYS